MKAEAEHAEAKLAHHGAHLRQMLAHLMAGLMQRLDRRARKLELAARLERDRAALIVGESDQSLAVAHRLPAEAHQSFEERTDAVGAVIGHGRVVAQTEDELLVLGADAPLRRWLCARGQIVDKLSLVGDGRTAGSRWSRHGAKTPDPLAICPRRPASAPARRAPVAGERLNHR